MKTNFIRFMNTIKHIFLTCAALFLSLLCVNAQKTIHGIIITGQNNHNWPVSHQAIKMTLENSELFSLDVAVSPKQGEDMSNFSVDFNKYKLVVLDYNGDSWSSAMNSAFMDYVRFGGGLFFSRAERLRS